MIALRIQVEVGLFWLEELKEDLFFKVISEPPYEVTETGWGEFEIMIKVFVNDPLEKPVTLYHHLQLYPKDEAQAKAKKAVVSEHFDEIVFHEPSEMMHSMLLEAPSIQPLIFKHAYS